MHLGLESLCSIRMCQNTNILLLTRRGSGKCLSISLPTSAPEIIISPEKPCPPNLGGDDSPGESSKITGFSSAFSGSLPKFGGEIFSPQIWGVGFSKLGRSAGAHCTERKRPRPLPDPHPPPLASPKSLLRLSIALNLLPQTSSLKPQRTPNRTTPNPPSSPTPAKKNAPKLHAMDPQSPRHAPPLHQKCPLNPLAAVRLTDLSPSCPTVVDCGQLQMSNHG